MNQQPPLKDPGLGCAIFVILALLALLAIMWLQ